MPDNATEELKKVSYHISLQCVKFLIVDLTVSNLQKVVEQIEVCATSGS